MNNQVENKKSFVHSVLLFLWNSFGSPLTLVTFFGPLVVLKLSFLFLKEKLRQNTDDYFDPLREMVLKNEWTEPMADFNVQFIVLIIVFVYAVYEILSNFFGLIKEHTINEVRSRIKNDTPTLLFIMITVGVIGIGITLLFLGSFSSPENIRLYKENAEYYNSIGWNVHPPPFGSNITWARIIIILIYSPISTYLLNKKLPLIFNHNSGNDPDKKI